MSRRVCHLPRRHALVALETFKSVLSTPQKSTINLFISDFSAGAARGIRGGGVEAPGGGRHQQAVRPAATAAAALMSIFRRAAAECVFINTGNASPQAAF